MVECGEGAKPGLDPITVWKAQRETEETEERAVHSKIVDASEKHKSKPARSLQSFTDSQILRLTLLSVSASGRAAGPRVTGGNLVGFLR